MTPTPMWRWAAAFTALVGVLTGLAALAVPALLARAGADPSRAGTWLAVASVLALAPVATAAYARLEAPARR